MGFTRIKPDEDLKPLSSYPGSGKPTAGGTAGLSGLRSGGGLDLRTLMGLGELKEGDYSQAYNIFTSLTPKEKREEELKTLREKEKIKGADKRAEKQRKVEMIDEALRLAKKPGIKTGVSWPSSFIPGEGTALKTGPGLRLKRQVRTGRRFGKATKDEEDFYNLIGSLKAGELFGIGGKVLPAQERKLLEPLIPEFTQPTSTVISQLERLKEKYESLEPEAFSEEPRKEAGEEEEERAPLDGLFSKFF